MEKRDRAGDKVRGEAFRLGFTGEFADSAEIEARLIQAGLANVTEALAGSRRMLDSYASLQRRDGRSPEGA